MTGPRVEDLIRPEIRALEAYHVPPAAGLVKLDAMENPYELPESLRPQWLERLAAAPINRYPDPQAGAVKAAVRAFLGLSPQAPMLLGNGSDELIQMLCLAVAGPGRTVVAPEPSFSMYRLIARVTGLEYAGVALGEGDFALDVEAMLAAIEARRPALVFLACPNNPTGNLFPRAGVERIVQAAPGLVIVDEAYYPFAGATMLELLARYRHLLVLQTLSKLGLAGLRIGVLIGAAEWLAELDKVRLPYNIGVLPQLAAVHALEHAEVLRTQARAICADRERLHAALAALPDVEVWPSRANFLLFRTSRPAAQVHRALRERGVLVKCLDGSHPLLAGCLRVTVGAPRENDAFLAALAAALGR